MSQAEQYQQQIISDVSQLPVEKMAEVAEYVSCLRQKYNRSRKKNIVKLGGLWKGVKISERDIKKLRTE